MGQGGWIDTCMPEQFTQKPFHEFIFTAGNSIILQTMIHCTFKTILESQSGPWIKLKLDQQTNYVNLHGPDDHL